MPGTVTSAWFFQPRQNSRCLPVRIALPEKPALRPGQLVDVYFKNEP